MNTSFINLFDEKIMKVGLEAENAQDIILQLGELMAARGFVETTYGKDVFEREKSFPTGLPTQPFAVAIPHADPDHVIISSIAIGVLQDPIIFQQMGSGGTIELSVPLVFMLALKDFKQQTAVIRDLITMIQNKDLLQSILEAQSAEEIHAVLVKTDTTNH